MILETKTPKGIYTPPKLNGKIYKYTYLVYMTGDYIEGMAKLLKTFEDIFEWELGMLEMSPVDLK